MIKRYGLYVMCQGFHQAVLGSLVASKTAPTIADSSRIDDTSNGSKYSLNSIFPKFFTRPRLGSLRITGCETPNAFKAATIVTKKEPPPITAANLTRFDLRGSDSLFRLISISVYKNNTKIAPIY